MENRPTSLTVIGWLLIVFGVWGVVAPFIMQGNPSYDAALEMSGQSAQTVMIMNVVGGIVSAVSGWGILKGLNWSRLLYIGYSVLGILYALATSPFTTMILVGLIFPAILAFFLFRPAADRWFGVRYLSKE